VRDHRMTRRDVGRSLASETASWNHDDRPATRHLDELNLIAIRLDVTDIGVPKLCHGAMKTCPASLQLYVAHLYERRELLGCFIQSMNVNPGDCLIYLRQW
jgi:hypothetical protein